MDREFRIILKGELVVYRLRRDRRSSGLRATARGDEGLVVHAGRRTPSWHVEEFLRAHSRWVLARWSELRRAWDQLFDPSGAPRVLLRGRWIPVEVSDGMVGRARVALDGEVLRVAVPRGTERRCAKPVERWFRQRARQEFAPLCEATADEMGVRYERLRIGGQRSRWGGYTSRGTVSLNWKILMAPADVYRYVVVHELAHVRHRNHSREFWALVERYCPEYRSHRRWLRENSLLLDAIASFSHLCDGRIAGKRWGFGLRAEDHR